MQLAFAWYSPGQKRSPHMGRPRAARTTVSCHRCGEKLTRYASQVTKRPEKRHFCTACFDKARRIGLKRRRPLSKIRELDRLHNGHPARIDSFGYVIVYEPDYYDPKRNRNVPIGFYPEHRFIIECAQRRRLRADQHVHHRNGIRTDNRLENLMIVSAKEHRQIHNNEIKEKLRRLARYEELFGPIDDRPNEPDEVTVIQ